MHGRGKNLFSKMPRLALGPAQAPTQWIPEVLSLKIKRPKHEADQSSASSLRVRAVELHVHSLCNFTVCTGITSPLCLLNTDQFTPKISISHMKYEWQIAVLYLNTVKHCLPGTNGEKGVQIDFADTQNNGALRKTVLMWALMKR